MPPTNLPEYKNNLLILILKIDANIPINDDKIVA